MQIWALGHYQRIADLIAAMARDLVGTAGIQPGQRVLDVGAGSGNAAIPAARAGAVVTALDVTPEMLDLGRAAAGDLPIEWVEGDAMDMPFADGTFDVVLSCFGAMFAPDHDATAREIVRVCRPGGLIVMANWVPDGNIGRFFEVLGKHGPAPATGPAPTLWGDPEHLRALFPGQPVECERRFVELEFSGTVEELVALYESSFGPVVAIRSALDDAGRAAFHRDLLDLFVAENEGTTGGPGRWRYPWLHVRIVTS